jgi:hypothetical protein
MFGSTTCTSVQELSCLACQFIATTIRELQVEMRTAFQPVLVSLLKGKFNFNSNLFCNIRYSRAGHILCSIYMTDINTIPIPAHLDSDRNRQCSVRSQPSSPAARHSSPSKSHARTWMRAPALPARPSAASPLRTAGEMNR